MDFIDDSLTDTTTLSQSGPESNGNERLSHTSQNWGLTIGCNLVSYPGHFMQGIKPCRQDKLEFEQQQISTDINILADNITVVRMVSILLLSSNSLSTFSGSWKCYTDTNYNLYHSHLNVP